MEEWEYWTGFLYADIDAKGAKEYLKQRWPDWQPAKYAPQAMIPDLNEMGKKGWELVHMQPVQKVGDNADIGFRGGSTAYDWSASYFCIFKRRVQPK